MNKIYNAYRNFIIKNLKKNNYSINTYDKMIKIKRGLKND